MLALENVLGHSEHWTDAIEYDMFDTFLPNGRNRRVRDTLRNIPGTE
jgi:hypothetical protein